MEDVVLHGITSGATRPRLPAPIYAALRPPHNGGLAADHGFM
jgi:hypothetical protein